jgi:cell division protein FtsQ
MVFLAASAIYGLSLSGAAEPLITDVTSIANGAAFDAGFRLEDLAISGARYVPQTSLLEALELPSTKSSLFYDASAAHDRVLKLGWIESAEIRRILPSRLEVTLSERAPFARFADAANKIQIIDREGHILGPEEDGRFQTLPLFAGAGAPREAAAFDDALAGHDDIRRRIDRAEFVAERFWLVRLQNGLVLKLPRKVSGLVLERLESLLANPKIAEMALDTIDLRLSNRTILQLREPTVANRDRAISSLNSLPGQSVPVPRKGRAL